MEKSLIFLEKASIFKNQLPNPTMKRLLLFLLLLISNLSFAQGQGKLDSLNAVLAKLPVEGKAFSSDTMRVKVLCEMGATTKEQKEVSFLYSKAIFLATNINYQEGLMIASFELAKYYRKQSLWVKASDYLFRALYSAETLKNHLFLGKIYKQIGDNYLSINETDNAIIYLKKSLLYLKKYESLKAYILTLNNIGIAYFKKKDYVNARKYYQLCQRENAQLRDLALINILRINIGSIYIKLKDFDKGISLFESVFNDLPEKDYYTKTYLKTELAKAFLEKGDFNSSSNSLTEAFTYCENNADSTTKAIMYEVQYQLYKKKKLAGKALDAFERYVSIKLADNEASNQKLYEAMKLEYQAEKQRSSIVSLNESVFREKQKNQFLILISIVILISLSLIFYNNRLLKRKNIQIEEQKIQILLTQEELKVLNENLKDVNESLELRVNERTAELVQMNKELITKNREIEEALLKGQTIERKRVASELHDNVGSLLSGLSWRLEALDKSNISENEKAVYNKIKETLKKAYGDVRSLSHNLIPEELQSLGLAKSIKRLIDDLNQNGKIKFDFHADNIENILSKKAEFELYSITLELTNNIIKHAHASEASIILDNKKKNVVRLFVLDDGVGLNTENIEKSMGLSNIKERIVSLNGSIEIETDSGTSFKIEIPYQLQATEHINETV